MRLTVLFATVVGGIGALHEHASAQNYPIETSTYSVEWINPAGPNSPAHGAVYVTITPDIGTLVQWNFAMPTIQEGTLKAFATSIIDLQNTQNGTTGILTWSVPAAVNLGGKPGKSDGKGGILGSNAGQFGPTGNPNPILTPKVKVLDLTWYTSDFSTMRYVEYTTKATGGKVYLDVGLPAWVGENTMRIDGSGGFWVAPAPTTGACMALFMSVFTRRRNRAACQLGC